MSQRPFAPLLREGCAQITMYAAVAYVRAAADWAGVLVREAPQTRDFYSVGGAWTRNG